MTTGSTQCLHLIWTPGLHITASSLTLRNRGKVDASGYSRSDRSMRRTENRWGGLLSQGIGTSMLQMGNIVRNPKIWIPPTLTAAITGPIATCVFHLHGGTLGGKPMEIGILL